MKSLSLLIGLLSALCVIHGCGGSEPTRESNPFRAEFNEWIELPIQSTNPKFLSLARGLPLGVKGLRSKRTFANLVSELCERGMDNTIDYLDEHLDDDDYLAILHRRCTMVGTRLRGETLTNLATRHPDSIALAPYRPDGLTYLVKMVASREQSIGRRLEALSLLSVLGDDTTIAALDLLKADDTAAATNASRVSGPVETLGMHVSETIRQIRDRLQMK